MAKISINLLPSEFLAQELKSTKFYKIQAIGVGIILLMIFLTSVTIALRIFQSQNIVRVQAQVEDAQQKVTDLKGTQASLVLLKDRLKAINQYLGTPSKQAAIYRLVEELAPPSIVITLITINRAGDTVLIGSVPNTATLDSFIDSLTSKEKNNGLIQEVTVESLNRSRDGVYRVSLKLKTV